MKQKLAWLLRTCFCTVWIISLLFFLSNAACALAETDMDASNALMIRAGYFGAVMLLAMLAHAFLISDYKKKNPPDREYPDNFDF
jgi:hypothetical protein